MESHIAVFKSKEIERTIHRNEWWIAVREELTDEWKKRDVRLEQEYTILTAEIAGAALGVTPDEHRELKGRKRRNLRDHVTDLELIFSILGEPATTKITGIEDAKGL